MEQPCTPDANPVFHPRTLGQHQHGQAGLLRAQVAQHADSVQLRQVQVENYQVIFELSCRRPSLFAIRKNVPGVVFAFETLANKPGERFIIFRNENSHNLNRP